jgi:hypothetical protein
MFEIAAKDQPVLIERLDINMGASTEPVQVYYRTGYVDYRYDDSYELIFDGDITGAGQGLATPLPPFTSPVLVTPGTPITIYVTVTNHDGANVYADVGTGSGTTYASDDNINIIEGMTSGYPWRGYALDRRWNGVVHYSLQTNSSPTESPTISLITPSPTNQPTNQPTKSPVVAVTQSPTASPVTPITSPPVVSTPNPTASPVVVRTGSPSNIIDDVGVVEAPTPAITNKPTTTDSDSTKSPTTSSTKRTGTQDPKEPTDEPSPSPTVDESYAPTKTVTNLLPNFDPSSASNRLNFMGRVCSYSFPLFVIAFFVL